MHRRLQTLIRARVVQVSAVVIAIAGCASIYDIEDPTLLEDGGLIADSGSDSSIDVDAAADAHVDTKPPCTNNAECDDGEFCNGNESCVEGKCQPGKAPTADITVCMSQGPCPENHYQSGTAAVPECGPACCCETTRVCAPACGKTLTVCCAGQPCNCPKGYTVQGATQAPCVCGTATTDALTCVRP